MVALWRPARSLATWRDARRAAADWFEVDILWRADQNQPDAHLLLVLALLFGGHGPDAGDYGLSPGVQWRIR
jgi:hypothetical protein